MSPAETGCRQASAPTGTAASLGISLLMAPSAHQEGMHNPCLPRQQATRVGSWDLNRVPSARLPEVVQQDVQGPLASNEGLINPGLGEPAQPPGWQ